MLPCFKPLQSQNQGPVPVTPVGVPAEHKPEVGDVDVGTLLAGPHTPTALGLVVAGTNGNKNTIMKINENHT